MKHIELIWRGGCHALRSVNMLNFAHSDGSCLNIDYLSSYPRQFSCVRRVWVSSFVHCVVIKQSITILRNLSFSNRRLILSHFSFHFISFRRLNLVHCIRFTDEGCVKNISSPIDTNVAIVFVQRLCSLRINHQVNSFFFLNETRDKAKHNQIYRQLLCFLLDWFQSCVYI